MKIEVTPVLDKKDFMQFIKFPWQIYKGNKVWVPPLISEMKKFLSPDHNPFFNHSEVELFVARKAGKVVGRIAAILNTRHIKVHKEKLGFFGFYDTIPEFEVSQVKREMSLYQRRVIRMIGLKNSMQIRANGKLITPGIEIAMPDFEGIAKNNPLLRQMILLTKIAEYGEKSANADYFPKVYASVGADRSGSQWPPSKNGWSAGIELTFPLFAGGERYYNTSSAESEYKQQAADEKTTRDNIMIILEQKWTALLNQIDLVEVRNRYLEAALERSRIAESQYSIGLISFDNWIIIEDELVREKKNSLDAVVNAMLAHAEWIQAIGGTLDYDN